MEEQRGPIAEQLDIIRERIRNAARRAGRSPDSVTLVAVSKKKPAEMLRQAYAAGQRDFGENYVQELSEKAEALADLTDIRFHLLGALQRNKVKQVLPIAALVHTVDREELAGEIEKRAGALGKVIPVLLEVNIGGEASKAGCSEASATVVAERIRELPHLSLRGLMAIPPSTEDPEEARPYFAALRSLRDKIGGDLPELSMGMSHDFEVAIEEGATIVRVGTAIFGART